MILLVVFLLAAYTRFSQKLQEASQGLIDDDIYAEAALIDLSVILVFTVLVLGVFRTTLEIQSPKNGDMHKIDNTRDFEA